MCSLQRVCTKCRQTRPAPPSLRRQSSATRPELVDRDPNNGLLARQARFRPEAEVVRDLFLATSGLLAPTVGGPSVRPPQPPGISELTYANSARWVESTTDDVLRIEEGSLYPALRRLEDNGWVTSEWGLSENNRRARYYTITRAGRAHLRAEATIWFRYAGAVTRVLQSSPAVS